MRNTSRFFFISLAGLSVALLAAAAGGCSGNDPPPQRTGAESQELYAAQQVKWPGGEVNVCFEATSDPNAGHWHDVVQAWATSSWQSHSGVVFRGWGTCGDVDGPVDGVRIQFQDSPSLGPHTNGFGNELAGLVGGMVLDNVYAGGTSGQNNGLGQPIETVLGWVTVHEFGHALGFPHEQDRPDALASASSATVPLYNGASFCGNPCTETACINAYLAGNFSKPSFNVNDWWDEALTYNGKPLGALTPLGTYDHVSVMNYCNTAGRYNNQGQLSPGDLAGVQAIYGPPFGADPINQASDPVSSRFPLSTVNLQTPGNMSPSCTGVILAATPTYTRILTAAHCNVGSTTTVQFYPTTNGAGALATGTVLPASTTTPVATQAIVGPCNADIPGSFPSTCVVNGPDGPYYADLAVLTVDSAPPDGYVAVALGARGSLSGDTIAPTAADGGTPSSWEVGTGWGGSMQWGPAYSNLSFGSGGGTAGVSSDYGGFFLLNAAPFTQRGDSGGPVYQEVTPPLTSPNGLILVGIAMSVGPCTGPGVCNYGPNTYTSAVYPANYDWLTTGQGGAPALPAPTSAEAISAFGAAQ